LTRQSDDHAILLVQPPQVAWRLAILLLSSLPIGRDGEYDS
jgi:hypothetical protein